MSERGLGLKMWLAVVDRGMTQQPVAVSAHFSEFGAMQVDATQAIPGRFFKPDELRELIKRAVELARTPETYNLHDPRGLRLEAEKNLPAPMRTIGFASGSRERSVADIVRELLGEV